MEVSLLVLVQALGVLGWGGIRSPSTHPVPLCTQDTPHANCLLLEPQPMSWSRANEHCRGLDGFLPDIDELQDVWKEGNSASTPPELQPPTFTWTALTLLDGHYQWLTLFPGLDTVVEWDNPPPPPAPTPSSCPALNATTSLFHMEDCSTELRFFCRLHNNVSTTTGVDTADLQLRVVPRCDLGCEADNGWLHVNENQFNSLALTCQVSQVTTGHILPENQTLVSWRKDGVYVGLHSPTVLPYIVHDPSKTWLSDTITHTDTRLLQGTFWCESWLPGSSSRLVSNKVLVTVDDWMVVVAAVNMEVSPASSISPSHVNSRLKQYLRPHLTHIDNYVVDTLKEAEPVIAAWPKRSLVRYRSQIHVPAQLLDMVIQLGVNNSARFKELCSGMGCQSGSSLSLATYCLPHTQIIGDGRRAMWPGSWAGLTQPDNMRCEVGNRLEYGMCRWNYTHGASVDAFNISKCDRYDYCPRGYIWIPSGLCVSHTSRSDWDSGFSKIYQSERVRSIMDVSFHAGSTEGQLPTYSYVRKMLRLAGHSILWLPVKRVRPFGRLTYQGPDLDLAIDQEPWNQSFVWKQGEPSIELDCLALNIGTNELFMEKCSANHSFVGIFDIPILPSNQFMTLPTPNCPMEWLGSIGSDHPVCCKLFTSTKVHTSKQAQQFCEERGAGLPSPSVGFLDWFYRQFLHDYKVDSVWMTEDTPPWLPSAVAERMDIVNWLPKTNFSLHSVELTPTGWTRQEKAATKSNILCQMKPLHNVDIELTLSKEELQPPRIMSKPQWRMCLSTNRWALWKGTPKCYVNGEELNITRNSSQECPYVIPVQRQGYYECRMWSRFPHILISSKAILHRQPRIQTFIVTFQSQSRGIGETDDICATHLIEKVKDKFPQSLLSDMSLRKTLYLQWREEIIHYLDILYSHDEEDEEEVYQVLISTRLPRECQLINVKSTRKCYKQVLPEFGIVRRNITWPETAGGSTATSEELCISKEGEPVARECSGDFLQGYEWSPPMDSCLGQPTDKTTSLWEISNDKTSQLADVPASLSSLTEDGSTLQPVDVLLVAKSFRSLSERKEQLSNKELEYVVDTLSNVMEAEYTTIESVQNKFMSSSILFKSFENMTFKVQFPEVEKDQMLHVPRPLLSVEYLSLKRDTNIIGYQTIDDKKVETLVLKGSTIEMLHSDAAIILPENLTSNLVIPFELPDGIHYESKIQLSFAVFKNSKLFQDTESFPNATVISPIIQATYKDRVIKYLEDPVKIIFKTPKHLRNRTFCVFWDFDKHDARGGWSTSGCWKGEGTDIHEVCYCDHLTCFAQLMNYDDLNDFDGFHGLALDIITIIGCCLSIFGLLLVFTTFLLFKKWRRPLDNKILVNLSFSVLCSLVIFLAGIKQTWNQVLCRSVAVALHYFILSSFGWMLVEAVHQYLKFVKVVGTYVPRFMWKASVCAWGLPLLPIVVVLVCDSSLYDNDGICWMSSQGFKYAFLPPLVVTMCVNIVVFSLILYGAVCGRARVTSTLSERELLLSQLRMGVCVFILLGFTWIFGLLAVWKGRLIFSYLFCIFNTLQGFFIFVFHIYRGRSARSLWEDFLSIISKTTPHSTDRSNSNNAHASLHYGSSGIRRLDLDSAVYNQARGIMSFPRKSFANRTATKQLSKTSSTICLHTKTNYTP